MTQSIGSTLEVNRPDARVTRHILWEAVSNGLRHLLADQATRADGQLGEPAEAWAATVSDWIRQRKVLDDGGYVDRLLVEALVEAECTLLEFSGESPGRVAEARRRFEDLSFGSLAPVAPGDERG